VLNGTNGQPLPNGSYTLGFQFWDHPTGTAVSNRVGSAVTVPDVAVTGGVASTAIPVQPDWFDGRTRYLGITVQGVNGGQELLPRVLVTAVPYATGFVGSQINLVGRDSAQIRGNDGTWLLGYVGTPGSENISIGAMDSPSGRSVTVMAGGFPRLRISANGNIGMGTASPPESLLHLDGIEPTIRLTDGSSDPSAVLRGNGGTWLLGYHGSPGNEDISIGAADSPSGRTVSINAGGFPRIRISANGNVGIGELSPHSQLDVNGTTRTTVLQITSARQAKQGFAPVDAAAILAKVAALPLSTWAYTNAPTIRHLGPVAQDFHAAFALGDDDQHIATVDADGVALAAIQGLHQLLKEKEARLAHLESAARAKDAQITRLEARLTALEQALEHRLRGISQPPARAEPESSATSPLSGKP
jgi:hypothetical protein